MTSGSRHGDHGVIPATGVGSGVIYDSDGWILTNRHVVEGSQTLRGRAQGRPRLRGQGLRHRHADGPCHRQGRCDGPADRGLGDSDALKVGQLVIAIGSPLGTYSNSVTSGIVSAKGRSITTDGNQNLNNLIQTDAAINPGNSGGPLLDAAGNVIGINTAIARDSNGIGFAIPIDIARPIMEQAVAGEDLAPPVHGRPLYDRDPPVRRRPRTCRSTRALVDRAATATRPAVSSPGRRPPRPAQDGDIITASTTRRSTRIIRSMPR